jgi:Skp family chaperone for outer membrane proteins
MKKLSPFVSIRCSHVALAPYALLVCGASILCGIRPASADFKFATVDLNRVLNESSVAKEQRKGLDALSQQTRKKLESKKSALSAIEKSLKEKGANEESKEVQEFGNEVKSFNRMVKDSEDEIKKEFLKINKTLTERALKVVEQYASKKGIDLVVDRSEKMRGPVLFGDPGVDISAEIIKELDKAS